MCVGGEAMGQPLSRMADVIRASRADIVGLQEVQTDSKIDNGQKLAELLGWNYLPQAGANGILTRFTILQPTPHGHGALLRTPSGREILHFNVHLAHAPYQPYQLLAIRYGRDAVFIKTESEAIAQARAARGHQVEALLDDRRASGASGCPTFITGDFNEPSHLDWTSDAARAGRCPIKVEFPSTRRIADAGFIDTYRQIHPDPVQSPGNTWTPTTRADDPKDRHDRIDFVMADRSVMVKSAQIIGEDAAHADIVVSPWPTDHRGVLARVRLSEGSAAAH